MVRKAVLVIGAMVALLALAAPASAQDSYELSVSREPVVGGSVTGTEEARFGDGAQIVDCGSDCSETVSEFETCIHRPAGDICTWHWPAVQVTANPAPGWMFNGWTGSGCTGEPSTCDIAGGTSSKSPEARFVDVRSPTASWTSPTPGAGDRVHGTVTLAATASDNWGISRVDFLRGGVPVGSDAGPPYSATFSTTGLTHGTDVTITARAFDRAGRSTDVSRTIEIDNRARGSFAAPTPAAGGFTRSATPEIAFTTDADVSGTKCGVDGDALDECTSPWTPAALAEGERTVHVQLTDDVGNVDTISRTFTVDSTDPVPTVHGAADGTRLPEGGRPTDTVTATDERGGPADLSVLDVRLGERWATSRRRTRVRKLVLKRVPEGARVEVRCKGRRCPFKRKRLTAHRSKLRLHKLFKRRKLRPGTRIEVRATLDGHVGRVFRYRIRKGRRLPKSTVLCLAPGASKPERCR